LAKGNQGNDHEDSFLYVWSWARWRPEPVPIASIYLELDLEHLPYEGTVDWLVQNREAIEVQAGAMLMVSGVTRVKMQYRELRDREQQRVIFRIVYREREKGPAIPHHLDYGQMIAAWGQAAQERQKYNGVEIMERERLALDILNYAIAHCGGTFPLKKLQAAFASEISHRQIESLGQRLEQAGILGEIRGNKPRLINLAAAAAYLEKHKAPPMQMFAANT
jgi:hypothetical protein